MGLLLTDGASAANEENGAKASKVEKNNPNRPDVAEPDLMLFFYTSKSKKQAACEVLCDAAPAGAADFRCRSFF